MFPRALFFLFVSAACFAQSANFQWVQQVGGSGIATIAGVATDSQGNSYVAGNTTSLDLAVRGAAQANPGGSGLYRIDGPGGAWRNLSQSGAISVTSVAVSAQHPQIVLAASDQGLLRSADGGQTWNTVVPTGPPPFNPPVFSVAIDPTNDALVYGVGTGGFFTSQDSGVTWGSVIGGSGGSNQRIWVDPSQPQVLFVTGGGLQRNANRGSVGWQVIQGLPAPLSLAFDPFTKGTIYAATLGAPQVSRDDGLTWSALASPDPTYTPQYILADPIHSGTLYATSYGGVFVSGDGGATWSRVFYGTNAGPMAADPVTGAIYIWVNGQVLMSTDGFATSSTVGPPSPQQVTSLAVAGSSLYEGVAATSDVFVTKFDPLGNIVYSTYFGGTGSDDALGIAVDPLGAAYVTGSTNSADFPVTKGAFATQGGSFLFKLNPDGSVAYSTYFSDGSSQPNTIAVDAGGHAFLAGTSHGNLPVTKGAFQTTFQGAFPPGFYLGPGPPPPTNGFVTEFSADGASLIYSTYLGNLNGTALALTLGPDGSAIVAGDSLYRVDASGAALLNTIKPAGTLFAVTADAAGNLYAAGGTGAANVSGTPGAFQTAPMNVPSLAGTLGNTGQGNAFVSKYDLQFHLLATTLLGGEAPDQAQAIAIAASGNLIVGGETDSKAFPTRGPAQSSFAAQTGFLAGLSADLSSLQVSTYAGDTRTFNIFSVAPMPDGGAVFAGSTTTPFFVTPYSNIDPRIPYAAGTQAFVVRTAFMGQSGPRVDAVLNAASRLAVPLTPGGTFMVMGAGFGNDAALLVNGTPLPLLSASSTALVAAVPLDFTSPPAATVTVQSGAGSSSVLAPFLAAAPGIFSVDGSGLGQGFILNADGTLNSASNPALEGSKITIYATGVGPMTFAGPYAVTTSPVEVLVDGFLAAGIAAVLGPVAGLPGNVYQISVYVPEPSLDADKNPNLLGFHLPSQVAVTFEVNGAKSQAGLAISVSH